jgi:hypothetical protein
VKKNKPSKAVSKKRITSEELDKKFARKFDRAESVLEYAGLDAGVFRVNVDFPSWTVTGLDREATRLGISRQALIKIWITEKLDHLASIKNTGS